MPGNPKHLSISSQHMPMDLVIVASRRQAYGKPRQHHVWTNDRPLISRPMPKSSIFTLRLWGIVFVLRGSQRTSVFYLEWSRLVEGYLDRRTMIQRKMICAQNDILVDSHMPCFMSIKGIRRSFHALCTRMSCEVQAMGRCQPPFATSEYTPLWDKYPISEILGSLVTSCRISGTQIQDFAH